MTEERDEEGCWLLAEQWLRRSGLVIKLDKGFAEGSYCVYVEFDALADRIGVTPARRKAADYCAALRPT